jgi:hypothetical protein
LTGAGPAAAAGELSPLPPLQPEKAGERTSSERIENALNFIAKPLL